MDKQVPRVDNAITEYASDAAAVPQARVIQRLASLLDRFSAGEIEELAGLDDAGLLDRLEQRVEAQAAPISAVARAKQRGRQARRRLFANADVVSLEQAAELLEIKAESVLKKIQRGGVLAIDFDGEKYLPSFQFSEGRVAPEMPALLKALEPAGDFTKLEWFIRPHPDFDEQRPTDLVGQRSNALLEAAQRFGSQGGA